jgi:hypothetical protein
MPAKAVRGWAPECGGSDGGTAKAPEVEVDMVGGFLCNEQASSVAPAPSGTHKP